jgi:hypothetical protein
MLLDPTRSMRFVWCALLVACAPRGHDPTAVPDASADAAGRQDAAVAADADVDAPPAATCQTVFRLANHASAHSVWMTGDYVAWAPDPSGGASPMVLGGDGVWTVKHPFNVGVYLYKFVVDGTQWIADPSNPDQVADGFGGQNSRFTCNP